MASPDVSPRYVYHLQVYGCTTAEYCVLKGTRSCPMNQEVRVRSKLPPKRLPRRFKIDAADARPFYEAVRRVGLIRRLSNGQESDSLPQDIPTGRENDQYQCDKIGGDRGRVYIRSL